MAPITTTANIPITIPAIEPPLRPPLLLLLPDELDELPPLLPPPVDWLFEELPPLG